jgi:hypothetical protein
MRLYPLWKKGLSAGIVILFVTIIWSPIGLAQVSTPQLHEKQSHPLVSGAQGFDIVFIWGTFEEKIHKFPLLSLEVRNRDPWDNHTINVFGLFKEGTTFRVYFIKAYWADCAPLHSVHLGLVGQSSLFVVASGRISVYQ